MFLEIVLKVLFVILLIIVAIRIAKNDQHKLDDFYNDLYHTLASDLDKIGEKAIKDKKKK